MFSLSAESNFSSALLCFGIMEFLMYLCCLIESHCFTDPYEVCPSTSNVAVLEGMHISRV